MRAISTAHSLQQEMIPYAQDPEMDGARLLALVIMAAVGGYLMVRSAGHPKIDGDLKLTGLSAPVKVVRDELGVPYITAANTPDLLKAQGFVTAQDRLLQMELFRATWRGELAATFGPDALPSDIRMRVLGMRRNGDRHALKLDAASRAYLSELRGWGECLCPGPPGGPSDRTESSRPEAQCLERGRPGDAGAFHPLHPFQPISRPRSWGRS
jgi:hypothetical protein